MELQRAVELVGGFLRCEPVETQESFEFSIRIRDQVVLFVATKTELASILSDLNAKMPTSDLSLFDHRKWEILVREESSVAVGPSRRDDLTVRDEDNRITYRVMVASDTYLLFFLEMVSALNEPRLYNRGYYPPMIDRWLADQESPPSVFDLIRRMLLRVKTIQVVTDTVTTPERMSALANSFLFQLAYNTDTSLVPQRGLESLSRASRISRMRRTRASDIDPPRRTYNADLIHHYLLAIATDNRVVEYLSHYHVLEHFYEAVFSNALIKKVQDLLTDPGFSYRRDKDIRALIRTVKKSWKIQNDSVSFSEEHALYLTLTEFIDLPSLIHELENYDTTIIEHFKRNPVAFANAPVVDLRGDDHATVLKSLAKRIYATRNALVHSKDGDKAKYTPFADDRALTFELPLMRFVAEKTILRNSTLIE